MAANPNRPDPRDIAGTVVLSLILQREGDRKLRDLRADMQAELEAAMIRIPELQRGLELVDAEIRRRAQDRRERPAIGSGRPSLRATILDIMASGSGAWTRDRLLDELERRDAAPHGKNPRNTVGNRLLEMAQRGEIRSLGDGRYAANNSQEEAQQEVW